VWRACSTTSPRDGDANKGPRGVWSGEDRHNGRKEAGSKEKQPPLPHKILPFTPSHGDHSSNTRTDALIRDVSSCRDRGGGDTHRRRGRMDADFSPSFSLIPEAFTPTTWRLDGGAGESAACWEGTRESVRFIAPTGRGGRVIPNRSLCCVVYLYCGV